MKIYLFDPETRIYLGEDFADEAPMERGAFVVLPGATTIVPPEGGRGHIMVFDETAQCWEIHSHWEQENPEDGQSVTQGN